MLYLSESNVHIHKMFNWLFLSNEQHTNIQDNFVLYYVKQFSEFFIVGLEC